METEQMQEAQKSKKSASGATLLIFLCWLVYTCSYLGKVNYSANIIRMEAYYQVNHSSAGLVSTLFFFAYGIGQVVNGLFCKKYNLKWIIAGSLAVCAISNLIVGVIENFAVIKYVWLVNGFAMSVLWPSLIRLLSETISKKHMAKACEIMGTTVAIGTFVIYGLSALMAKLSFKLIFYIAAGALGVVCLIWVACVSRFIKKAKAEDDDEESLQVAVNNTVKTESTGKGFLLFMVVMLGVYGVFTNLIKDGLTTWVPSILKEQYDLDDSISIILTLALPVVSIFANAFAVRLHKKIPNFVVQCALVFVSASAIIGLVIAGLSLGQFIITLIGFAIVCFLVSSNNSAITSIFPLFMKGKINSGLAAGILNGCCYLGSTISSYGLGTIADSFGWNAVFWLLFAVCMVAGLLAVVYKMVELIKNKK